MCRIGSSTLGSVRMIRLYIPDRPLMLALISESSRMAGFAHSRAMNGLIPGLGTFQPSSV